MSSPLLKPVPFQDFPIPIYGTRVYSPICSNQNSNSSLISLFSSITFLTQLISWSSWLDLKTYPEVLLFSLSHHISHIRLINFSIISPAPMQHFLFDPFSNYFPPLHSGLDTPPCCSSITLDMFLPQDFTFYLCSA